MAAIAEEGRIPVVVAAAVAITCGIAVDWTWSVPGWLAFCLLAYWFRLPKVKPTGSPLRVVAPVTGRVTGVGPTYDPWLRRPVLRVTIDIGLPGLGVLFSPFTGQVIQYWTDLDPDELEDPDEDDWLDDWLESPTRYTLGIETDRGDAVVYSVSSTHAHSRLKFDHAPGERTARARRGGFFYFASSADVLLPRGSNLEVAVGDRVAAGSGVLATLGAIRGSASDESESA